MEKYEDRVIEVLCSASFGSMEPHGQARGPQQTYPPTHLGAEALRRASAKASVGHPPIGEILRSTARSIGVMIAAKAMHSSTAKAVVSCVGG
jgi:hypothetical protein